MALLLSESFPVRCNYWSYSGSASYIHYLSATIYNPLVAGLSGTTVNWLIHAIVMSNNVQAPTSTDVPSDDGIWFNIRESSSRVVTWIAGAGRTSTTLPLYRTHLFTLYILLRCLHRHLLLGFKDEGPGPAILFDLNACVSLSRFAILVLVGCQFSILSHYMHRLVVPISSPFKPEEFLSKIFGFKFESHDSIGVGEDATNQS
ncbi:hypothetical protein BDN72DRAFT_865153 [Pluteus cervinus]|uniref:Uncharacterized protein n=1 Tax=Pluteus cervinus TaxID=181527 RepID=A0ACD3A188_9AGAR|nr:hypothetical protein BDN72DRAFT_865153 [Pluteus cervinus]